jgi:O-succinylbenzoic acid--CoA ligase
MVPSSEMFCGSLQSWPLPSGRLLLNPRLREDLVRRVLEERLPSRGEFLWLATSGRSGGSKLRVVALSKAALEASALQVNATLNLAKSDLWLSPLPPFHVGGFSVVVRAALSGCKHESFGAWDASLFVNAVHRFSATVVSLVPTQVFDLVRLRLACPDTIRAVVVGGGALAQSLHTRALELGWPVLRSYGMTETASQVATEARPCSSSSAWLPLLDHFEARTDQHGVLELRGPSLLTGWMIFENDGTARWEDPKRDGWFRTSDRVELRGRELRVLGRVDDLVKIRGELVDVGALETALQALVPEGRVAVQCLPDERNGAALRVVAENAAALKQARALRDEIFPPYARPEEFIEGPVEVTALGKTVRRPGSRGARPPRP